MRTITGSAGITAASSLAGLWLGIFVTNPSSTSWAVGWIVLTLPLLWLAFPQLALAYASSFLAWWIPLHHESPAVHVILVTGNLVVWAGIGSSLAWGV